VTLYRDETLSQGRAERKTPGSDITDSVCKFADIIVFEDVSRRAMASSLEHIGYMRVCGQDHDARTGHTLAHLPGHLQTAETRHPDIDNEHVRTEAFDQGDRIQSIARLSENTQVLMTAEHGLEALTDKRVAMCEEDGDRQRESFLLDVWSHGCAAALSLSLECPEQKCPQCHGIPWVANHGHW